MPVILIEVIEADDVVLEQAGQDPGFEAELAADLLAAEVLRGF